MYVPSPHAVSRCTRRLWTYVLRKYGGKGNAHLTSACVKQREREALSLFRVGVAPAFVSEFRKGSRFSRTCMFCEFIYGSLHVDDVFHTLFICPLLTSERIAMWDALDTRCGAAEWNACDTLITLGVSLLCPQSSETARVVGNFLSASLARRELYFTVRGGSAMECKSSKWIGGNRGTIEIENMKKNVVSLVDTRLGANAVLPFHVCDITCAWVTRHSLQPLDDAFRSVRSWLEPGWAANIGTSAKRPKSVAMF